MCIRDRVTRFGATGAWIHDLAHGRDSRRVTPGRQEKSHGRERTFPKDLEDREELRRLLYEFCEEVAYDLRDKGLRGRTISIKARYWNFRTVTRSKTLPYATNLGLRIFSTCRDLLERVPKGPLRLLGVTVSNLEDVRLPTQESLFGDVFEPAADARMSKATESLDRLRKKYGKNLVQPGSTLRKDDGSNRS